MVNLILPNKKHLVFLTKKDIRKRFCLGHVAALGPRLQASRVAASYLTVQQSPGHQNLTHLKITSGSQG
jgi:hypothetical protein